MSTMNGTITTLRSTDAAAWPSVLVGEGDDESSAPKELSSFAEPDDVAAGDDGFKTVSYKQKLMSQPPVRNENCQPEAPGLPQKYTNQYATNQQQPKYSNSYRQRPSASLYRPPYLESHGQQCCNVTTTYPQTHQQCGHQCQHSNVPPPPIMQCGHQCQSQTCGGGQYQQPRFQAQRYPRKPSYNYRPPDATVHHHHHHREQREGSFNEQHCCSRSCSNTAFQTPRIQGQYSKPVRKVSWQTPNNYSGESANNRKYSSSPNQQLQERKSNVPIGSPFYHRMFPSANDCYKRKISAPTGPASVGNSTRTSLPGSRWDVLSPGNENGYESCGNGESEYEIEEPFSESEDEETPEEKEIRLKRQSKPILLLPTPRRRIRTLSGTIPAIGYSPVWGGPTMCLKCLLFFDLPKETSNYVDHLLEYHKIVITDIELIVDLKRYIEYWRRRFGETPIEKIFPLVTPTEEDPLFGKVDSYYLMSDKLPEDRKTRERLAMRRLEEVIACQQRERQDNAFSRQCLFCRYVIEGNRSKIIHHLYAIHHLNLGSPDNLVFVSEYLDALEDKMKKNECMYCEKVFYCYHTLLEHMRKKLHREVNPNNNYYDRFYVINYLQLGKKWLEVLAEDFEDNTTTFVDSDDEDEEEAWNEWQEDAEAAESDMITTCLFCEDSFDNAATLLGHMKVKHNYNLKKVFHTGRFSFYDRIKFINYIRKANHKLLCFACGMQRESSDDLRTHLSLSDHVNLPIVKKTWDKDEYLVPTYDNDNVLCLLEDILELKDDDFVYTTSAPTIENSVEEDEGAEKPETNGADASDGESTGTAAEQKESEGDNTAAAETEANATTSISTTDTEGQLSEKKPSSIVIPEDLPDIGDSLLNDPELREQLQ